MRVDNEYSEEEEKNIWANVSVRSAHQMKQQQQQQQLLAACMKSACQMDLTNTICNDIWHVTERKKYNNSTDDDDDDNIGKSLNII